MFKLHASSVRDSHYTWEKNGKGGGWCEEYKQKLHKCKEDNNNNDTIDSDKKKNNDTIDPEI